MSRDNRMLYQVNIIVYIIIVIIYFNAIVIQMKINKKNDELLKTL